MNTLQPKAAPRLRTPDRSFVDPVPRSLDQLLPPDHTARLIWDFTARLDLSALLDSIRAVEGVPGRAANHPRLLFALWLFATIDGVGSARELDRLCQEHLAYRWLCGGVSMNYHALADFRVDHADLLDQLLTDVVAALLSQDLIALRRLAQDGLKVRASAGKASFHRDKTLQRYYDQAQAQVQALRRQVEEDPGAVTRRQQKARERSARERAERAEQALRVLPQLRAQKEARQKGSGTQEKVRASSMDPEARVMKMADGGYRPAYNVQFATATSGGVVVGVIVTNAGNDGGQLTPMVEQIKERYDQKPKEMVADGSYAGAPDIEALHRQGVAVIAPVRDEQKKVTLGKDPYQPVRGDKAGMKAWRERMGTAAAKELYRLRCATAEWVNAGARNRGLQQFGVRGKQKVRAVALWQALAHNVLRTLALESGRAGSGCARGGGK